MNVKIAKLFNFVIFVMFLPSFALAQTTPIGVTSVNQEAVLGVNGRTKVDGQSVSNVKLDILTDKYVWRYEAYNVPKRSIDDLTVNLQLPPTVTADQVKPTIYAVHGVDTYGASILSQSTIQFTAQGIGPEAIVTLTLDLPPTALRLSAWDRLVMIVQRLPLPYWVALAVSIPTLMILASLALYLSRLADINLKPTPQAQSTPPSQLSPALVGTLVDGAVGVREISATLIDLARRGYIDIIHRGGNDFGFSRKRAWQKDAKLQEFERFFLTQLLPTKEGPGAPVSNLAEISLQLNRQIWSETISQAIERIYQQMQSLGYFPANPRQSHMIIRFIGIIVFFVSVLGLAVSLIFFGQQPLAALPWLVSLIFSPLIVRLALLVPRRTAAGRLEAARWLAFRRTLSQRTFVKYADEADQYEVYLAYAIVLGVEGEWTARFTKIACQLPTWFFSQADIINSYEGLADALFSIVGFVSTKFSFSRKPTDL